MLRDLLPGRRARSVCGLEGACAWSAGARRRAGRSDVNERLAEEAESPGSRCEMRMDVCSSVGYRAARRRGRGDRRRLRRWLRGQRPPPPALREAQVAEHWRRGAVESGSVAPRMAKRRVDRAACGSAGSAPCLVASRYRASLRAPSGARCSRSSPLTFGSRGARSMRQCGRARGSPLLLPSRRAGVSSEARRRTGRPSRTRRSTTAWPASEERGSRERRWRARPAKRISCVRVAAAPRQ